MPPSAGLPGAVVYVRARACAHSVRRRQQADVRGWRRGTAGAISSSSAMKEKLIFDFHTMLISAIACLVAFTGCSGIERTAENHRVTTNLVKYIEADHEKPKVPRVHPGQPYDQGFPGLY